MKKEVKYKMARLKEKLHYKIKMEAIKRRQSINQFLEELITKLLP